MPPKKPTPPTWSVSTPSQVQAGELPELQGGNAKNRDRLRTARALKAGKLYSNTENLVLIKNPDFSGKRY